MYIKCYWMFSQFGQFAKSVPYCADHQLVLLHFQLKLHHGAYLLIIYWYGFRTVLFIWRLYGHISFAPTETETSTTRGITPEAHSLTNTHVQSVWDETHLLAAPDSPSTVHGLCTHRHTALYVHLPQSPSIRHTHTRTLRLRLPWTAACSRSTVRPHSSLYWASGTIPNTAEK